MSTEHPVIKLKQIFSLYLTKKVVYELNTRVTSRNSIL